MSGNAAGDYGTPDEAETIATIHAAIDLGVTHLDTAEAYRPSANEALPGRAIEGRRNGLVVATKFFFHYNPEGGTAPAIDGSPANSRRSCAAALRSLGVDVIDLSTCIASIPPSCRREHRRHG